MKLTADQIEAAKLTRTVFQDLEAERISVEGARDCMSALRDACGDDWNIVKFAALSTS